MVEAKKGRPISMSFFDLFVTPKPRSSDLIHRHGTISRDASGRPALIRTRKKAPKESDASPAGSTKAGPPASPKAEEPPRTQVTVSTWTVVEDAALLGLKAQRKSWEEISETMAGKGLEAIKERYRLLYDLAPVEVKGEEAEAKEKSKEGKVNAGGEGVRAKAAEKKGNPWAKRVEVKSKEEAAKLWKTPTSTQGMNKEYADEELSTDDIMRLQGMKDHYDERKWVELSSRFFDMVGKRIDPDLLKDRLK